MFFITHIDKFFHNSPGTEMCLGTPHFKKKIGYRSGQVPLNNFQFLIILPQDCSY